MLTLLLLLSGPARADGFHFLKVEALGGVDDGGTWEGGVGAGTFSDALHLWGSFGDPAADGRVLRELWFDSRVQGPTLGVVPEAFLDIVPVYPRPWLFRWAGGRLGTDAHAGKTFEAEVWRYQVLNGLGFTPADPHRAYLGPALGLGLEATWWEGWRGGEAPVMTGKLSGRGGVVAGATARDTVYAQARLVGQVDLFGRHQAGWVVGGSAGVFLQRVGVPVGVELSAEREAGNDNVSAAPDASWEARASVYWKLAPPYQTRLEERVQRGLASTREVGAPAR